MLLICVFIQAFEHLMDLELVRPLETSSTRSHHQLVRLMLSDDQLHDAICKYDKLPTHVKQWGAELSISIQN